MYQSLALRGCSLISFANAPACEAKRFASLADFNELAHARSSRSLNFLNFTPHSSARGGACENAHEPKLPKL
ncbi:hypothetical protein, partial [Sphingomonas sp. WG]|uniref:hypothetical protein n=1 Tax=Sphingomonas sp. WG TaxID=1592629 RepID=UPI001F2ADB6D